MPFYQSVADDSMTALYGAIGHYSPFPIRRIGRQWPDAGTRAASIMDEVPLNRIRAIRFITDAVSNSLAACNNE